MIQSVEKIDLVALVYNSRIEGSSILTQRARVSAKTRLYKATTFTGHGLSKKQAQREAVETVLQTIVACMFSYFLVSLQPS